MGAVSDALKHRESCRTVAFEKRHLGFYDSDTAGAGIDQAVRKVVETLHIVVQTPVIEQ